MIVYFSKFCKVYNIERIMKREALKVKGKLNSRAFMNKKLKNINLNNK